MDRGGLPELLRLKARALVTTHLSVLKAVAYTIPRVDNGPVEFHPESLKPTFHLRLGEPGRSNALIIAKRLGMTARLVKAAKGYLAEGTQALNRAIAGTPKSRREAEQAWKAAREPELEAQCSRQDYQRQLEELKRSQCPILRLDLVIVDLIVTDPRGEE